MRLRTGSEEESIAMASTEGITYTVTDEDISGIQFKCVDAVHTTWTGGYTEQTSSVIAPIRKSNFDLLPLSKSTLISGILSCNYGLYCSKYFML